MNSLQLNAQMNYVKNMANKYGMEVMEEAFKSDDECSNCGALVFIIWSPKYHGYLAICKKCDSQWRVS